MLCMSRSCASRSEGLHRSLSVAPEPEDGLPVVLLLLLLPPLTVRIHPLRLVGVVHVAAGQVHLQPHRVCVCVRKKPQNEARPSGAGVTYGYLPNTERRVAASTPVVILTREKPVTLSGDRRTT